MVCLWNLSEILLGLGVVDDETNRRDAMVGTTGSMIVSPSRFILFKDIGRISGGAGAILLNYKRNHFCLVHNSKNFFMRKISLKFYGTVKVIIQIKVQGEIKQIKCWCKV